METGNDHDRELGFRHRAANVDEHAHARELAERMVLAAFALVERFGYSRHGIVSALDYELRERLQDAAEEDAAFRQWHRAWRKANPGTE